MNWHRGIKGCSKNPSDLYWSSFWFIFYLFFGWNGPIRPSYTAGDMGYAYVGKVTVTCLHTSGDNILWCSGDYGPEHTFLYWPPTPTPTPNFLAPFSSFVFVICMYFRYNIHPTKISNREAPVKTHYAIIFMLICVWNELFVAMKKRHQVEKGITDVKLCW